MLIARTVRISLQELQQSWRRLADSAFGRAVPAEGDQAARGEFISPFICERGLNFPSARREDIRP